MARTRLTTYTAPPADVLAALDALRADADVPAEFPPEALAEAEDAARAWEAGGPERYLASGHGDGIPVRDARDLALVTIDPPGSMDLDQAVLLERLAPTDGAAAAQPEGAGTGATGAEGAVVPTAVACGSASGPAAYRVTYAIADLAAFVTPGGALDVELSRRGETVYAPDRATPLHPEVLSHGAASLLPDQDRPSCLWTIELDATGRVLAAGVERALVRSRARLTYAQVQEALDAGAGAQEGAAGPLPGAVPVVLPELLREIGTLREEREVARGGVSLESPEQEIEPTGETGPDGAPAGYRLVFRAALPVEQWNAQVSLLTGICAARTMVAAGIGILRTMPPAGAKDYARLRRVARALHVEWPDAMGYPELVRTLDPALPTHAAFIDQALSLFRGAGYLAFGVGGVPVPVDDDEADTSEAVHSAIASRYAHVTAPLRRLVDRYGEEVCVAACAGAPVPEWARAALPGLPGVMASTGQRARAVGRGAVAALEALVLRGHEGEDFEGVITSAKEGRDAAPRRGEVMIAEPAVVGTVTARADELRVGERVRVRLEAVDVAEGRIDFVLPA